MNEFLFKNVYEALTFAFNFSSQQYGKSPMIKITQTPTKEGKGLGGLDGAAQAGFILSECSRLGILSNAILTARFAPPDLPSDKGNFPELDGRIINQIWAKAIIDIAEYLHNYALKQFDVEMRVCWLFVQRHFLGRKAVTLADIQNADVRYTYKNVRTQYKHVQRFFNGFWKKGEWVKGQEEIAVSRIHEQLKKIGMIGES